MWMEVDGIAASAADRSVKSVANMPDEVLSLVSSYLDFMSIFQLSHTNRALHTLPPSAASHCIQMPYSPPKYPQDYTGGINSLLRLPADHAPSTSWRLQLWLQHRLHRVLVDAEQAALLAANDNSANSSSANSPNKPVQSSANAIPVLSNFSPHGIILPPYVPKRSRALLPDADRTTVFTVHTTALMQFALSPTGLLIDRPHVLEAFMRQLCEIYDRFLYQQLYNRKQNEIIRQGFGFFDEYEVGERVDESDLEPLPNADDMHDDAGATATDTSMNDVSFSSTTPTAASSTRKPDEYLYGNDIPLREDEAFLVQQVPQAVLVRLLQLLNAPSHAEDHRFHSLGCRVLGILALREENRQHLVPIGGLKYILTQLSRPNASRQLISNAAWSLVIAARPLGASEGSTFFHPLNFQNQAVNAICRGLSDDENSRAGLDLIASLMQKYVIYPKVLGKLCWSLVNLSVNESNKNAVVSAGLIEVVLSNWKLYPQQRDFVYRSVFCCINLIMLSEARSRMLNAGLVDRILEGLKQFPYFWQLQKSFAVLVRALCFSNSQFLAENPALLSLLLRLYLHAMPGSLYPNPPIRELVLLAVEQTGSTVQQEILMFNERAERTGVEKLEMIRGLEAKQPTSGNISATTSPHHPAANDQSSAVSSAMNVGSSSFLSTDTSSTSDPSTSSSSSTAPAVPVSLTPGQLRRDRLRVTQTMSARHMSALVNWHRAQRNLDAQSEDPIDVNNDIHPHSSMLFGFPMTYAAFNESLDRLEQHQRRMCEQNMEFEAEEDDLDGDPSSRSPAQGSTRSDESDDVAAADSALDTSDEIDHAEELRQASAQFSPPRRR